MGCAEFMDPMGLGTTVWYMIMGPISITTMIPFISMVNVFALAPEYYDQAVQIIDKAPKVTNNKDQWMPLGVFAVTQDAKKASDMVLQLAVNKEGAIQGTYFNSDDNTAKPIKGMVDKESERAVWTFADKNKNAVIMETGIYNLTKDQTGVLVHFGKERTQEWLMVRLNEPSDKEKQTAPKTAE